MSLNNASAEDNRLNKLLGFLAHDPLNTILLSDALSLAISMQATVAAPQLLAHVEEHSIKDGVVNAHLSHLLLMAQDHASAARHGELAIASGINHPAVLFNTAVARFYTADYAGSASLLEQLSNQPDATPVVLILHARALHHLESDDAEALVVRALALEPDNLEARGLLSLLLYERDAYDEALQQAHDVLAHQPDQLDALLACASTHADQGRTEAAHKTWLHTVRAHPYCGRAWSGLALIEFHELEFTLAEEHLKIAIDYMPDHIGTWHVLAWIYILRGDSVQAREALDRSYSLDRNFGETHGGLAVVDVMDGRLDNARLGIRRALKLNPHSMSARYAEVLLLKLEGRTEEAAALVNDTLDLPTADGSTGRLLVERWFAEHQGHAQQKPPASRH